MKSNVFDNLLDYEIIEQHAERVVHLRTYPPQDLTRADMDRWMIAVRDKDSDLHAQLVHAYVLLTKPSPSEKPIRR